MEERRSLRDTQAQVDDLQSQQRIDTFQDGEASPRLAGYMQDVI